MSWGKLPSGWLQPQGEKPEDREDDQRSYPLRFFEWRKDGGSSAAALMTLLALSLKLNLSMKNWQSGGEEGSDTPRPQSIGVSYEELRLMTGCAKKTLSSAINLLVDVGAVERVKIGRANQYKLLGLDAPGSWCQVPQEALLKRDGTLKIKDMERKRKTLFALKLYVLLLALRNRRDNKATISYSGITKWSGIRREDIGQAIQILIAYDLVKVSAASVDQDDRYIEEGDRSNRYHISGL